MAIPPVVVSKPATPAAEIDRILLGLSGPKGAVPAPRPQGQLPDVALQTEHSIETLFVVNCPASMTPAAITPKDAPGVEKGSAPSPTQDSAQPWFVVECPAAPMVPVVPTSAESAPKPQLTLSPTTPSHAEPPISVECPAAAPADQQPEPAITGSRPPDQPFIAVDCPAGPTQGTGETVPDPGVEQSKGDGPGSPLQQSPELARLVKTFDVRRLTISADREPVNPSLASAAEPKSEGIVRGEQQRPAGVAEAVSDELSAAGSRGFSDAGAHAYRQTVQDSARLTLLRELQAGSIQQNLNTSKLTSEGSEEPRLTTVSSFTETTLTVQEALDIRRIAQRAGQELAANRTNWVQMPISSDSGRSRELLTASKTPKATDGGEGIFTQTVLAGDRRPEASLPVNNAEIVQRVRPQVEPPPPPPVARHLSIQIGEADSQVNVVIRERNGDLAIQFGAATERLRENLQNAAPLLLHQLQREAAHAPAVQLNFSSFGSATDAGRNANQDQREKKPLKSDADFAALEELTALNGGDASEKLLEFHNLDN